jgi:hypothetical protein
MIYFLIASHFQVIKFQFSSELNLDFFFLFLWNVFGQASADEMPAAAGQGIVKKISFNKLSNLIDESRNC